jgi:hypothetical protein
MKTSIQSLLACAAVAALTVATGVQADEAKATPKAAPTAKPVARAVASTKVRPLSVSVDLISPTKIIGTLTDTTSLDMRTSFGTANIPLSEVAGIRFASADNASTTVVMLNGDSITGATDVKLVSVETEWGQATINGQNIASIMFVPGLAWNATTGLNGSRWTLVNAKAMQASKTAAATAAAAKAASSAPAASNRTTTSRYPNTPQPVYRGR